MYEVAKKNFSFLLIGQFISLIGDRILVAMYLSIVAILVSSQNSWTSNLLIILQFIPLFFLGFYFGSLADIYNRKYLLIISESIRILSIILLLFVQDNLVLIYLTVLILGFGYALFEPARKSILPFLIKREDLVSWNKLYSTIELIGLLVGLLIASVILSFVSITTAIMITIFTYVCSILFLSLIYYNHTKIKEELSKEEEEEYLQRKIISSNTSNYNIFKNQYVRIKKGLSYVSTNSNLRSIFIVIFIHFLACCMFFATLNDFVIKTTSNSIDVGSIVSFYLLLIAIGAITAYPLLQYIKHIRDGVITIISLGIGTILLFIFSIIIEFKIFELAPFVLWGVLLLIGVIVGIQYLRFMYLLQIYSKKEFMGRVMSVFEFITSLTIILGIGIGMILSEILGYDMAFYIIVLVYGSGFIYFFIKRTLVTW
ncbi:MAG: MFS transporter [Candidatus Woesearchaeota archaeon]